MRELLTPKQVARAIDVSESSIKRWCDKGVIATQYTVGGHRRISLAGLLDFLKKGKHQLVCPAALGLPATSGHTARVVARGRSQMTEALLAGDERRCLQIAIDLHLAEHSVSVICDDTIAAAMRDIGEGWACGDLEVYQERRSCEIALRVLHELRSLLPAVPAGAPVAIGGTAANDQYALGTSMAEVVLRNAQWNALSLGGNLPFATLAAAIQAQQPKLFWLSCSHMEDPTAFLDGYDKLYEEFGGTIAFVVGGQALDEPVRQQMKYAAYCESMQHLDGFARTMLDAMRSAESEPSELAETPTSGH